MMNSTIKLYSMNNNISEDRNFIIDNISSFLEQNSRAVTTIVKNQYIKHNLENTLIIKANQELQDDLDYDYCTIQNNDERIYYYFVKSCAWTSENSVTLVLKLDSLNTFSRGSDYYISNKSTIVRKHEDRFKVVKSSKTFPVNFTYIEDVDGYHKYSYTFTDILGNVEMDDIQENRTVYSNKDEDDYLEIASSEFDEDNNQWKTIINLYSVNNTSATLFVQLFIFVREIIRNIDYKSEGLTLPKYKKEEETIQDVDDKVAKNWFLVYRNNDSINPNDYNQVNPVNTYLVADTEFNMLDYDLTTYVNLSITAPTTCLIVSPLNNNNVNNLIKCYSGINGTGTKQQFDISIIDRGIHYLIGYGNVRELNYYGVRFLLEGSDITAQEIIMTEYRNPNTEMPVHYEYQTYGNKFICKSITFNSEELNYSSHNSATLIQSNQYDSTWIRTRIPTATTIKSINEIDRTDSKLIKIIKLPYCPLNVAVYDEGGFEDVLHFTDFEDYEVVDNLIKINTTIEPLNKVLYYDGFWKPLYNGIVKTRYNVRKYGNLDSKLFNGEFYNKRLVYDSFGYTFNYEKYNNEIPYSDENNRDRLEIGFFTTNTINSRFLCKFENWLQKYSQEDYDNILYISRNNELTIFSNQYINYLRTGYNYDVKAKERQINQNVMNMGASLLNAGLNMANPFNVASNLVMMPNHIMSNLYSIAQAEDSMNRKITEAKYQATSVFGADDVDLLDVYTDNKIKVCDYEVSDIAKKTLDNLFYYYGYTCDEYIDNTLLNTYLNSRLWFNYVQANLVIKAFYIKEEYVEDIVSKFKEGVTQLHKYNSGDDDEWDYEQEMENWEVSLINNHYIY